MKPVLRRFAMRAPRSIGARIVLLALGLLLVIQAASLVAIDSSLGRHARSTVPEQLRVGERVLQSLLDQEAGKLAAGGRLLAADYGFRSAVLSNDAETIASVLENHGARIGATEVLLLDTDFRMRAASGREAQSLGPLLPVIAGRLAAHADSGAASSEIALVHGQPHQLVMVPVRAPVVMGWVLMGFPLGDRVAGDMRSLSSLHLTLLTRGAREERWTTAMTSLPRALADRLAEQPWPAGPDPGAATMRPVVLDGEEFGVHAKRLSLANPAAPEAGGAAGDGAVLALISLSIDEATRPPRGMQTALLTITLLGFSAFGIGSALTARRVTTPLRELAAAAERLGGGDTTTPMQGTRRHDEVGDLAHAFEAMRISVGQTQEQMLRLAYWDSLTGLPNRVQLREQVREAIADAESAGSSVALILLDLNRFKHVNDVLGYVVGDLLLARVGERLRQQVVREGDLVARLGGDEFAVLLRNGHAALAQAVARRIAAAFEAPLTIEDQTVDIGASFGIACWPQHASDADALLNRAEVAMYSAKQRSDGPMLYDPSLDAASSQTLSLLSGLRTALDHGDFRLYLQPKVALADGRVTGAEALLRWQHPERGLVPPAEFIPFAEQTGFIRSLTMWVFEEAARQWLTLLAQGSQVGAFTLSVNLSTRDLLDPELPHKFEALLDRHGVPAQAFCLEITESAIMDDPQRALATLERLSAIGFKLSIDDFGTGYSSLAYLKRLPVDELKIDKSFVMSMESDADDAKIVRSTIDLAHNLGLLVVAEGVENGKAWDLLRELDCDQSQGYHMGRPMPAEQFAAWAVSWAARHRAREGEAGSVAGGRGAGATAGGAGARGEPCAIVGHAGSVPAGGV